MKEKKSHIGGKANKRTVIFEANRNITVHAGGSRILPGKQIKHDMRRLASDVHLNVISKSVEQPSLYKTKPAGRESGSHSLTALHHFKTFQKW